MYTIFYNEVPIYLTDCDKNSLQNSFFNKDDITIEAVLEKIKSGSYEEIYLYHEDLKMLWKEFKWFFKIEKAAGGLVKNNIGKLLFIYRFDKWDLPKGKIEKGEKKHKAAIREVEEECGIKGLSILRKLKKTYHIFQRNGRETLKITYWYEMQTSFEGKLIPQIEEEITKAIFKNSKETEKALENTYKNIELLFNNSINRVL